MPAASSKPDKLGSHEPVDPMKNAIIVIEKKVRNLEKRKGKLDSYRALRDAGDKLNRDQQEAVEKYDSVMLNLEFARELHKQFLSIQTDAEKLLKKQAKKERLIQQAQEVKKVQEVLQLQNTLDNMGSEDVREHFLNGTSGAVKLTQEDLDHLDELYKLISPTREGESSYQDQLTHASEHIVNFLDAKEKEVAGTTYKSLKELVTKIIESGYFDKKGETEEKEEEVEPSTETEPAEETGNITEETDTYRPNEVSPPVEQPEIHNSLLNHESVSSVEESVVNEPHHTPLLGVHQVASGDFSQQPQTEEESFFTTEAFPQPRPFQEIVSSVQGTFNFLQESQIVDEVAANDPAVIVATSTSLAHQAQDSHLVQPVSYKSNNLLNNDSGMSSAPTQSSAVTSGIPADSMGGAADHSGAAVPGGLVSQPHDTYGSSGQDYFMATQQPNTVSGLSFMSEQMGGLEQGLGAASEVPPAIPMPNQNPMNMGGGEASQEQMSEDKKPLFQMNPNAKMFRSMYTGPGQGSNGGYSQSGAMGEDGGYSQGHDYQGFGSNGYGQRSGRGRGGPRGSGRGMSNGYSRGGRNGNPSGGYGGRRDGGYQNGNSRGSGNRGYPQAYTAYRGGNRGGPPRGGQMRGRGGMSGGFGVPRGGASSQATA